MRKQMKKWAGLTLTAALTVSMTGCMPSQSETTVAPTETKAEEKKETVVETSAESGNMEINTTDPITIRFNWWGGDSRHEATLKAIDAFEAKYPNITVEAEYEAFSGHEEKVALALNAGSAADVIHLNMDWVFAYSPDGKTFC